VLVASLDGYRPIWRPTRAEEETSTVTRPHFRRQHQGQGYRAIAFALTAAFLIFLTGIQLFGADPARANARSGGSQTVDVTINVPAMVLDNLCNADVVNLSGDMRIITTTTPTGNGGYTVQSSAIAKGLHGERIEPLPAIRYHGGDATNTFSYYAPPPYPSTHRVIHWTKLVSQGRAPDMYLVMVLRETTTANGTTVPLFERAYLQCDTPKCSSEPI
jgi:hypothetical protein